jgi:predicted O-methyltransferase YrrM
MEASTNFFAAEPGPVVTETGPAAPNFEGPLGRTANPIRMLYMLGAVWRLSQSLRSESIRILEIGSWTGMSALAWADAIQFYFGGRGTITCVDAWQPFVDMNANPNPNYQDTDAILRSGEAYEVFQNNMRSLPATVTLEVHRGWSRDVLPSLQEEAYDLVYIDGDHSYATARSDIANSMKLVRQGGIISGDELELQLQDGVPDISADKPGIDENYEPERKVWYHPGVTKAVGEAFGPVSAWFGFWAMRKREDGWQAVELDGMPIRIPRHVPPKTIFALKRVMMEVGLI